MAGVLLDTNVLSEFARSQPSVQVQRWFASTPNDSLFVSVLTLAELRRGIELMVVGKRRAELNVWLGELELTFGDRVLPITKAVGYRWAVLSAHAQQRGTLRPVMDSLIAATALEHDLTVATRNVGDFASLGVAILNPWETP